MEEMVRAQKEMLQRFEKTNEMLTNVNSLSAVRLDKVLTKWMMLILSSPRYTLGQQRLQEAHSECCGDEEGS